MLAIEGPNAASTTETMGEIEPSEIVVEESASAAAEAAAPSPAARQQSPRGAIGQVDGGWEGGGGGNVAPPSLGDSPAPIDSLASVTRGVSIPRPWGLWHRPAHAPCLVTTITQSSSNRDR